MHLTLYVMNQKGLSVLQALHETYGTDLIGHVVGSRDPAVLNDYYEDILSYCQAHNLPFSDRKTFVARNTSHALAIGWRWMIPESESLIVFHDSLLPRYRGFAPLVSCLINEEQQVGVTALLASEEYDRGPILEQMALDVRYPVTIAEMIERISTLYAEIAVRIGARIVRGESLQGVPQDERQATYSLWRDEDDYWIDWKSSAAAIRRFVDSVGYPYQGAAAMMGERKVAVLEAEEVSDVQIENRVPGKVIFLHEGIPTVVCGEGLLQLRAVVDDKTREPVLPMRQFRVRFRSCH